MAFFWIRAQQPIWPVVVSCPVNQPNPFDIAAQAQAQALTEEQVARAQQIEIDDVKWLMSNTKGRRIVYRLLEQAGVYRLSFNTNALSMAFNEGARNSGLRLLHQVSTHCPERYAEMLNEKGEYDRRSSRDVRSS